MKSDPAQAHVTHQWKYDPSPLICCRFDSQGEYLFATAEDATLQRWHVPSGTRQLWGRHDSWINCLAVTAEGQAVISGGCDGRLRWWPARLDAPPEKPEPLRSLDAHQGWVRALALNPAGNLLASGGNDRVVRLWDVATGSLVRELVGHEAHVYSVGFHPGGEWLVSGDLRGSIRQWRVADGTAERTFDGKTLHSYNGGQGVDFGGVRTIGFSGDGKLLACGGLHKAENPLGAVHEPLVLLFDWEAGKLLQSHVAEGMKGVAWRVVFHPDGYLLGVSGGSSGGFLIFWKPDQAKEFHRFQVPNLARDLDLHPDLLQVAITCFDRHARIIKLAAKA